MKAWADAQQQFWETWQTMAGSSVPYTQLFEQWRALAAQMIKDWPGADPTGAADSITRQVAEQFIASQTAMMRFIDMTLNAWADTRAEDRSRAKTGRRCSRLTPSRCASSLPRLGLAHDRAGR